MSFRRGFIEKLKIVKKAGLPVTKRSVTILNRVSRKNKNKL